MKGLMQDWPLLVHTVLDHASRWHGEREIVARTPEGSLHRYAYGDLDRRSRRLASAAARRLAIAHGDVVATIAWNTHRHLEVWYGLMGLGAIVHTLNPRLFQDQLDYIVNHAGDRWIFLDAAFLPILENLASRLKSVEGFVIMTDRDHMPETSLANVTCYEDLIAEGAPDFSWPKLDENTACGMCYTSGTTGKPKGVVYSHRSNVLHAMAATAGDALALSSRDTVMPIVPMFHANAWSLCFSVPMAGAKLVLPGPRMDGASIYELLMSEKVTLSAAVPTIWMMLLQHLEKNPALELPYPKRVIIGGSACPEAMARIFVERYGTDVIHGWGMTEMSPLGTLSTMKGGLDDLPAGEKWKLRLKQGRPFYTVEMKITDDENRELPHDGKTFGRLKVKGPAVARSYVRSEGASAFDRDGWFDTGDVSTLDEYGYMQITDRSKDVIKSGGEWISSIELENIALGCPGVAEAAAIGLPHLKWDERPLMIVQKKPGAEITREDVLNHLRDKVAKWWLPDDVVFIDEIPHTATGKISKVALRERFRDYRFPS
jgi:acyl-CoA synthetase (AMP-forming)/AMP-acid ligase II